MKATAPVGAGSGNDVWVSKLELFSCTGAKRETKGTYTFSAAAWEYMHFSTVSRLVQDPQGVRLSHLSLRRLHFQVQVDPGVSGEK